MNIVPKLVQNLESLLASPEHRSISQRAIRHLVAGGIGTLLYMAGVTLLVEVGGSSPVQAVVVSFLCLEIYTYTISRTWVYNASEGHKKSVPRFIALAALTLALNAGLMYLVVDVFDQWYFWGVVTTTLVIPPTNFLLSYYWAFR